MEFSLGCLLRNIAPYSVIPIRSFFDFMIIHCPGCNKRISSRNKACPHCRIEIGDSGEGADAEHVSARLAMHRRHRLQMQMYIALFILVGGAVWVWAGSEGFVKEPGTLSLATLTIGALWYIGIRIYMIYSKLRGSNR